MKNIKGELKVANKDYVNYGLKKNETYDWEDGQRLNSSNYKKDEYKWWYTDGHLTNDMFFLLDFIMILIKQES